jgi:ADP-ribose pyrophosphatase YjhB (NUDIX family)
MGEQEGHEHDPRPARRADPVLSPAIPAASRAGPRLGLFRRMLLRLAHLWFLLRRGVTMGVRVIALDPAGRVFLVRHSYVPGWHLPGGGIEPGQTAQMALAAELREEGNLRLADAPMLFAAYLNRGASQRDHVLLYVTRNVEQTAPRLPDHEIVECGFFALEALPETTTAGTRRRLAEWQGRCVVDPLW